MPEDLVASFAPISLSKYRVGMSLVGGANHGPQPGSDLLAT